MNPLHQLEPSQSSSLTCLSELLQVGRLDLVVVKQLAETLRVSHGDFCTSDGVGKGEESLRVGDGDADEGGFEGVAMNVDLHHQIAS